MSPSASSLWSPISGGITAPEGFQAAGIHAGLKQSQRADLALLLAPSGAVCAGTFTQSLTRAACVDLCIERLHDSGFRARAVLINSGQANACTGDRGRIDSLRVTSLLSDHLGLSVDEVLICSTGVIGVPIPMDKLLVSLGPLVEELNHEGGSSAAKAIMTTDLVDKQIALKADLGGRCVRLGGMAKGSGMIHPNMGTMLAYLSCDAGIPVDVWREMIKRVVDNSFNLISVDGDTSTNDSLLAFSAGQSLDSKYWPILEDGLLLLSQYLSKAIVRDGEGANCLLEVQVEGAKSFNDAKLIARTVSSSLLVKTALHGCDPNWGRIVAAVGRSGISFRLSELSIWLGPYQLMHGGEPLKFDYDAASNYMKERFQGAYLVDDSVCIRLKVGDGFGSSFAWGCDLSDEYVRINADYTT